MPFKELHLPVSTNSSVVWLILFYSTWTIQAWLSLAYQSFPQNLPLISPEDHLFVPFKELHLPVPTNSVVFTTTTKQFDKLTEYTLDILKQAFQFIDFIKKIKRHKHFFTEVLRILKDIVDKYPSNSQQLSTQRDTRSSSSDIATFFSFLEKWIIDNSTRRKAIKDFIKILLNIEKAAAKLDLIDYRITSLNELLARDMRDWNTLDKSKNKNKQRRESIEHMNNQDELSADIDFSQTQEAESNHESNTRSSQSSSIQALFAGMKARIVKLMQQILFDFMKAQQQASSILSRLFTALHQREDRLISRSSSYDQASSIKWNSADIGFFDPHFNDKTIATTFAMKHSEKDIYFRNIHLFLKRCSNIATIKGEQLVRDNLFICLRELTLQWYINKMISNVKTLVKYAPRIEHWFAKLLARFKKKSNVALFILMKEKYIFENVRNQRESREYAFIILRATKSTNLASSDQISMIWNDLDVEFQRDIHRSKEGTNLDDFLNALDEFKDIWWQLTRRRMSAMYRNSNYRSTSYQHSKERTDQYQQFEEKSYNISESFEEYRKNYFRSGFTSNFNANYNNK